MDLPKAILFDLDDTIVAYDAVTEPTWRSICARFAPLAGTDGPESLYDAIDAASEWYWSDAERHRKGRHDLQTARREAVWLAFEKLGLDDAELCRQIADTYTVEREEAVELIPQARETLSRLAGAGVRLAMMTNGPADTQRAKIERFRLAEFFELILVEGEMGFGKPDPRVYERALGYLAVDSADVWAVGDNLLWDVAGPQKMGIFGIWNDWAYRGLPADSPVVPDRIVNRIAELA